MLMMWSMRGLGIQQTIEWILGLSLVVILCVWNVVCQHCSLSRELIYPVCNSVGSKC